MILSKLPCPDCGATGVDKLRGGLCRRCNGEGKARPTAAEEEMQVRASQLCPCGVVTGCCNGSCGAYLKPSSMRSGDHKV